MIFRKKKPSNLNSYSGSAAWSMPGVPKQQPYPNAQCLPGAGPANLVSNFPLSLGPGAVIPVPNINIPSYLTTTISYADYIQLWPYQGRELDKQEIELIKDFKTRHPDFDTLAEEINLVTHRKPGLLNTPLFMALIYDLAIQIRDIINKATTENVEEVLDGKTEDSNRNE